MNKTRRAELARIKGELEEVEKEVIELSERLEGLMEELESVKDDEEMAFDNLPESLQEGERGELMQDAMIHIESAMDAADTVASSLQESAEGFSDIYDYISEASA